MKITALRLFNVRRFANRGVAIEGIGDGVNVLSAENEFGKSTSFEALHALFFQHHSSVGNEVRSLRPYSGGRPLIEADVVTAQGAFRIAKQFYGKGAARVADLANGRLIAQADEAEAFIAALTRGGAAGPSGLLWVRQGVTGVEKRSKSDEDSDANRRATLLQSVQGEVEAITGGRRMADIMTKVQTELDDLVTPRGHARAGGRYALAIEKRNRLADEEDRLRRDVALLRDALDKRVDATRREEELGDAHEEARRKKAIETAQAAFDAARSRSEALRTAQAELALTQAQAAEARRALADLRTARERAARIALGLDEAERGRRDAQNRREAANEAASIARAEFESAERLEDEARKRLAQAELALRAQEARARLAELERRLEAAETLGKTIEADEAALKWTKLPEKTVAELEALHLDIARLAAVAEAARPTVTARYEPDAPIVSLDRAPLKAGEPRGYDGLAELAIPGVGLFTLRSFHSPGGDEKLRDAKERQAALLAAMGVDSLDAAHARQAQALRLAGDLRDARSRLSVLAPEGLPRLREAALARRAAAIDMPGISEDADHARANSEAATARKAAARAAWTAVGPSQARATDALIEAQTKLAALESERAQIDAVLGAPGTREEREANLDAELTRLDAQTSAQMQNVARLRQAPDDLDAAAATLRRLRSAGEAIEAERARLRETIADLSGAINARAEDSVDEDWRECVDALAAANARVAACEKEIAVLRRLLAALEAARGRARETYLQPVMNELRPLLRLLFDDVSIAFDEKTLVPHKIVRAGQGENVADLSGGMREQLSILTRLAFARLLAKDGRPAPVILDDALVYSDDERIEKMFDALHRQAADQQIIVFSCRQRAFQSLGGTVLRMVDWTPG